MLGLQLPQTSGGASSCGRFSYYALLSPEALPPLHKRCVCGHPEILMQGLGSRQLLQAIIIAVAGFSDLEFYEKIER